MSGHAEHGWQPESSALSNSSRWMVGGGIVGTAVLIIIIGGGILLAGDRGSNNISESQWNKTSGKHVVRLCVHSALSGLPNSPPSTTEYRGKGKAMPAEEKAIVNPAGNGEAGQPKFEAPSSAACVLMQVSDHAESSG